MCIRDSFVMMNLPEDFEAGLPAADKLDLSDKWVLSRLNHLAKAATENLEKFELGLAAQKIQDFIWEVYCDWYIEIAKVRLNGSDPVEANTARKVLVYVLTQALKLLHPFMPFITEEIYHALPGTGESLSLIHISWTTRPPLALCRPSVTPAAPTSRSSPVAAS